MFTYVATVDLDLRSRIFVVRWQHLVGNASIEGSSISFFFLQISFFLFFQISFLFKLALYCDSEMQPPTLSSRIKSNQLLIVLWLQRCDWKTICIAIILNPNRFICMCTACKTPFSHFLCSKIRGFLLVWYWQTEFLRWNRAHIDVQYTQH